MLGLNPSPDSIFYRNRRLLIVGLGVMLLAVFILFATQPNTRSHAGGRLCPATVHTIGRWLESQIETSGVLSDPPEEIRGLPVRCPISQTNLIVMSKWEASNSVCLVVLCPQHHDSVFIDVFPVGK